MKVIALLQTFNERRFIANCIEHLYDQGVSVYLIDNQSTDNTVAIAERYQGRGIVGIESLPKSVSHDLPGQLKRKEEIARNIDADWLMHIDADELHVSPDPRRSLQQEFQAADDAGFNAVNFLEFAFVPTLEEPDHDHEHYLRTMRWYYPLAPVFPHRLNAWRKQDGPIDLVSSDGHVVSFPGLRMFPRVQYMHHYLFLSIAHAREKYEHNGAFYITTPQHSNNWRIHFDASGVVLPSQRRMRRYIPGVPLDRSEPERAHLPIYPHLATRRSQRPG